MLHHPTLYAEIYSILLPVVLCLFSILHCACVLLTITLCRQCSSVRPSVLVKYLHVLYSITFLQLFLAYDFFPFRAVYATT
jgi:hypothetical protein